MRTYYIHCGLPCSCLCKQLGKASAVARQGGDYSGGGTKKEINSKNWWLRRSLQIMRKQLDPRIPILINNNVKKNHRSFIVLIGDKGRDQVRLQAPPVTPD